MGLYEYALLFLFLGSVAFTMIYVGVMGAKKDNASQVSKQITTLGITNFFIILIFGFLTSYYLESYPNMFQRYMILMVHSSLFLSLMAVSIASLNSLL
jgi:hypothetical protein